MARFAVSDVTKSAASSFSVALAGAWDGAAVKGQDGKIDRHQTELALSLALRAHLRATGQIVSKARASGPDIDWTNLQNGVYAAFVALPPTATGPGGSPEAPLSAVIYKSVEVLGVPYDQIDKARKIVRASLDRPESIFQLTAAAGRFGGTKVTLKAPAAPPPLQAFTKWGQASTHPQPTQAQAAAAHAAPKANGKAPKGK